MTAVTLHPIAIAAVMVNFAAKLGVDTDTCLLATDINPEQLKDPEALIKREQEMQLIENLILALPDRPALGFELGLQYNLATFGPWGFALRTSQNLRQAASLALRFLPLSTAYCQLSVTQSTEEFGLTASCDNIPHHLRQFLLERDIATGINLMRELSLTGIAIRSLEFTGSSGPDSERIEQLCGIKPRYHRSRNAVTLAARDADAPLPMYDPHFVRLLESQCQAQLTRRQTSGITGQVQSLLLGPLGLATTLEECAQRLALSPRSLRRKLNGEGHSFRALLENERKSLAEQLLSATDMKIEELAIHLGYTDTASFHRAFKRWRGLSPSEYRQQQASPQAG